MAGLPQTRLHDIMDGESVNHNASDAMRAIRRSLVSGGRVLTDAEKHTLDRCHRDLGLIATRMDSMVQTRRLEIEHSPHTANEPA